MAINVATLTAKLEADTRDFQAGMQKAQAQAQAFGDKVHNFGETATRVGKKMTTHLSLPIVAGLGLAAKSFGDFEQSLNTFQAVSSATGMEMERVGKLAKDLGNDVKLPSASALDAAESMTELAKGGLSVAESMNAARGVLLLATAAQIGNAEAATITANALNAFKLRGKDAAKVADLLAAAANASSAEITDVAFGFQMAGTVFSQFGFTVEDLTTSLALMANAGIRGSDAGTSLKSAFMHLTAPSKTAAGYMRELGINIYNADGSMKSFRDIVGIVSNSVKGLTEQQRNQAFATIFGTDGIRAANVVLAAGTKEYDDMTKAVTKTGAAQKLAEAKTKDFKGQLEALHSQFQTLTITIGPIITQFLSGLIPVISKAVEWFGKLDPGIQTIILAGAGLVAILGPLITVIGSLSVAIGFLAANPIVLIIAGIAALAVGLVIAYQKCETFRNIVNAVFEAVRVVVGNVIANMLQGFGWLLKAIANVAEIAAKVPGPWQGAMRDIAGAIRGAEGTLNGFIATARGGFDSGTDAVNRFTGALQHLNSVSINQAAPVVNLGGPVRARAHGGPVSAMRPYMVGERGPEMFVPGQSGAIIPNGGGTGVTYNITIAPGVLTRDGAREILEGLRDLQHGGGPLGLN